MPSITFRIETPDDEAFLRRLYASTREDEMALTDWPLEQQTVFINLQFDLQRHHYRSFYPNADFLLVSNLNKPIGRFYINCDAKAYQLIDISLLPDSRGQGVGGLLLKSLLDQASAQAKPVRLQVACCNRAIDLYSRLGFAPTGGDDVYRQMEWHPT